MLALRARDRWRGHELRGAGEQTRWLQICHVQRYQIDAVLYEYVCAIDAIYGEYGHTILSIDEILDCAHCACINFQFHFSHVLFDTIVVNCAVQVCICVLHVSPWMRTGINTVDSFNVFNFYFSFVDCRSCNCSICVAMCFMVIETQYCSNTLSVYGNIMLVYVLLFIYNFFQFSFFFSPFIPLSPPLARVWIEFKYCFRVMQLRNESIRWC